jgi:transposase
MSKVTMIGCDLHLRSILLQYSIADNTPQQASFVNDAAGRAKMIDMLLKFAEKHGSIRIVFAYEASSLGYGLCDQLHECGIECHVLSPTHLPKSAKQAKQKTDAKDAMMLLEVVRGHILAGNSLPAVWTPPQRLRDDRELVRARIDASDETTKIKLQILSMFKRRGVEKPDWYSTWTKRFVKWLREIVAGMDEFVAPVLEILIDRYELLVKHQAKLDKCLKKLSQTSRYKVAAEELRKLPGVGLLTTMTFLTEMGDLNRFQNRREIAAYLGLCPSSHESGDANDRKGHITRQGPSRVRKLLCQAAWVAITRCPETSKDYDRIRGGKKNRTKKALVAIMRQLAIKMWHKAKACGVDSELDGRGGPHSPELSRKPAA